MKLESIRIRNYKVFKDVELSDLPNLVIFVGANGTGKTTLFDLFSFIRDAFENNVSTALQKRGGFKEVVSREQTGPIEIKLKFRIPINDKSRLVTYRLVIIKRGGKAFISREILSYKRGPYGSPFHFLDFSNGEGYFISNEEDFDKEEERLTRDHQKLGSSDILAIKAVGQFERFKAANEFRKFIESWHLSDFHISQARPSRESGYAQHLSTTGDNLPLVAHFMYEEHKESFKEILEKMKQRVPGISEVTLEPTIDGRLVLCFQDGAFKDPFIAKHVSDGTIKMFAYLILLHDPRPHPLLCIEEPENQLYPQLLTELLEEFRLYAQKGGQAFVSTHSPDLVNGAELDEVYWLVKSKGYAKISRASEDEKIEMLFNEGDKLGYLWSQNYFKGSNPS